MNAVAYLPNHAAGDPDFDALLAPLSPGAPCGPHIGHDAVFTEIRLLREEDDPGLPMGQWERPLRRADWPRIEGLCTAILAARSKDLQLASWLAESWTRQRGLAGLADGLRLLDALLRRYWVALHPAIGDDGDSEARLAPLEWLNRSLAACVRVHVPLFTLDRDKPLPMTLALWERMAVQEAAPADAAGRDAPGDAEPPLARADIGAGLEQARPALAAAGAAIAASLVSLRSMTAFLHERLHDDAPNLGKLEAALEACQRVLAQCRPGQLPGTDDRSEAVHGGHDPAASAPDAEVPDDVVAAVRVTTVEIANWRNRREAYLTLEALADYLGEIEPHSPTPFLIRRAASWGRMSLPEVIAEIIREEGDASRLFQVLGIKL